MPNCFLIRVQLHQEEDYTAFHAAMKKRGMERIVTGDNGIVYDLPNGTYFAEAEVELSNVLAAAKSAAAELGHTAKIIVAETNRLMWSGLDEHQPSLLDLIGPYAKTSAR